jgi:D-glycero-D-manno-heptose 1,7-bisphosphate phosphatase
MERLKTVFLDRDGVLNRKMPEGHYVTRWEEFELLPGVVEAIRLLNNEKMRVVVVSNQRGVSLGLYTEDDVRSIHERLQQLIASGGARVDAFFFCPHNKNACDCRKPLPGLFHQAQAQFPEIDAATSVMFGDSKSDMEFGRGLGMVNIFVDGDPERQKPGVEAARELADIRATSLLDGINRLLVWKRGHGTHASSMCLGFPAP